MLPDVIRHRGQQLGGRRPDEHTTDQGEGYQLRVRVYVDRHGPIVTRRRPQQGR